MKNRYIRFYLELLKFHVAIEKRKRSGSLDNLVQCLSKGCHPVAVGGPKPSLTTFRNSIEDMGYVLIKFTGTHGGTDLGMWIDINSTDLKHAHFDRHTGIAHVEGTLILNNINLRCIADIELATLQGTGRLEVQPILH
jgi:hypothetical protein